MAARGDATKDSEVSSLIAETAAILPATPEADVATAAFEGNQAPGQRLRWIR
jgi:hypothetical protein